MSKRQAWAYIDRNSELLRRTARQIWERPELPLEEVYASEIQAALLREAGFRVTLGLKGLPTAILAEYGEGKPVIGLLGEYDALSGLSQDCAAARRPLKEGGPGHGCGHNLLGVACMGAAMALTEAIDRGEIRGTIRYYGCPPRRS